MSSVPKAKLSAVDQSIALPSSKTFILKSNIFFSVLCKLKLFGTLLIFLPISTNLFLSTPLTPLLSFPRPGLNLDQAPSNQVSSDL